MKKMVKYVLFIVSSWAINKSLPELSHLEDVDESLENLKCGRFKIFDFRLIFFVKNLNEILSESYTV